MLKKNQQEEEAEAELFVDKRAWVTVGMGSCDPKGLTEGVDGKSDVEM
jgi:hypothetical protein